MAQRLRALAVLPEDLNWIPSIPMGVHNCPCLQLQGLKCPLLTSEVTRHTHGALTHMQDVRFPTVCCEYHWLIKKLAGPIARWNLVRREKLS